MYFVDGFACSNVLGDNENFTVVVIGLDFNIHRTRREVLIITCCAEYSVFVLRKGHEDTH